MNRKTEVKVKFFDFLIMLQLSFTFRLPECSRPIIGQMSIGKCNKTKKYF